MSQKLYTESDIADIADAIREKNGLSDTYKVSDMANAIRSIPSGGSGNLVVKKISWTGTDSWYKDIEIPIEDIKCTVLRIVATYQGTGVKYPLGAETFDWGSNYIRYSNQSSWETVNQVSYTAPNIMHVVGAGQSPSQCFNLGDTLYDMYYTTWE